MLIRILIGLLRFKGSLRKKRSLEPSTIESILIVELTRLGDVITMLPAVRLIARHYPSAKIRILADERYATFLRSANLPATISGVVDPETSEGFLSAVAFVRTQKVDLAISMSPPKRNAAVTLASGAQRKVGYLRFSDTLTPYLHQHQIESFGCDLPEKTVFAGENIEERSLKICSALGMGSDKIDAFLTLPDSDSPHVDMVQRRKENHRPRKLIVVHPFSGWEYRSWDLNKFNELASLIIKNLNAQVLFLCEKVDEPKLSANKQHFRDMRDVFFFASDNLIDTASVLKRADVFVCNDSGPLHLAASLGVRTVALFGPATPEQTGPRFLSGEFLYKKVECSPCNQKVCLRAEAPCMSLISPDEVMRSIMRQLKVQSVAKAVANA